MKALSAPKLAGTSDDTGQGRSEEASQGSRAPSARSVVEAATGGTQPAANTKVSCSGLLVLLAEVHDVLRSLVSSPQHV